MSGVYQRVLRYIERHRLFGPGDGVVVGVSGGADSVALLHILWRLRQRYDLKLYVAHLNHLLRGQEAEEDARFVAELAGSLALPCTVGREDVAALAARAGVGIEEAGRMARYRFLETVADEVGARRVAVGHTRDDQAETVLMRLLRGTGAEGLAGIPPVRDRVVRPLLGVGHAELEEYCRGQGLSWRVDPSNFSPVFFRNRVRHELLPWLEERFARGIRERLAEMAEALRADVAWLQEREGEALAALARPEEGGLSFSRTQLLGLPEALARRVLRRAILSRQQPGRQLGYEHVQSVLDLVREREPGRGREVSLPGGVVARLEGERLFILPEGGQDRPLAYAYLFEVPGSLEVPEAGLRLGAHVFPAAGREAAGVQTDAWPRVAWRVLVDYNKAGAQLLVRSWRAGDRFYPLGMESPKKLQDFFVDEKVPRVQRQRIPLVLSGEEIVWVVGYRLDHRFRVTPATREILALEASRLEEGGQGNE